MIKLLLKQPLNGWRELGGLHKFEIIALIILIYSYLIGRINYLVISWTTAGTVTFAGLSAAVLQVFVLSMFISGPFILLYLLPRQKGLRSLQLHIHDKIDFVKLCAYYYHKYQVIHAALALPVILAFAVPAPGQALIFFIFYVSYTIFIFLSLLILLVRSKKLASFFLSAFLLTVVQSALFILFYWIIPAINFFNLLFPVTGFLLIYLVQRKLTVPHIEQLFPDEQKTFSMRKSGRLSFDNLPKFLPRRLQHSFNKEILSLWRNPHYRRLKTVTLLSYLAGLLLFYFWPIEQKELWVTLLTGLLTWLHYSNHFNEKYIQPEPAWYFATIPVRFYQVWLSKFMVEFFYIVIILGSYFLFLLSTPLALGETWQLALFLLIFSVIILSVMLNFQILFFDDPRLAGYAYHFTIVFLLIMSVNYRLVGPIISVFLLSFYFYKSYKYFNR